jgi:hypothetical protein
MPAAAGPYNCPSPPCCKQRPKKRLPAPLTQAIVNTLLSKVHLKKKAGFKVTQKTQAAANPSLQIQNAFMSRLTSFTRRFNQAQLPQLYAPQAQPAGAWGAGCRASRANSSASTPLETK